MGAECQWRVPPPGPRKSTSPPSKKRLTNGTPKVSNGGPARPGNVGASERGIPSSELLLQHPACIDALLTLWFRELDWMYDICRGTMLERLWRERGAAALIDDRHRDKFAFLVLAISAITCQMAPGDASTVFFTAGWNIGLDQLELMADACFRAADGRIEQLFGSAPQHVGDSGHCYVLEAVPLEAFQASLLLCAYCKNLGKPALYRERLFLEIARLQRAGLHQRMTRFPSAEHRTLAHRLFWAFFTYDRLAIALDPLPYSLVAAHADMYLQDEDGEVRHIYELCGIPDPLTATHFQGGSEYALSPFLTRMARLAALVGKYTDQLAMLRTRLGIAPDSVVGQYLEQIAVQADTELSLFEQALRASASAASNMHPTANAGYTQVGMQIQPCTPTLLPAQRHVVLMTIGKLRRDVAKRLMQYVAGYLPIPRSLERQRLAGARALLERAFAVPNEVPMRNMGCSFFIFFISEPVREILGDLDSGYYDLEREQDTFQHDLTCVLRGRNFLTLIARETRSKLARTVAQETSHYAREVLRAPLGPEDSVLAEMDKQDGLLDVAAVVEPASARRMNASLLVPSELGASATRTETPTIASSQGFLESIQSLEQLLSTFGGGVPLR